MPFRERLGPRIGKDPFGIGNKLGAEVEPNQALWLETDADQYDVWSYGVRVTGEGVAEEILAVGATGVVEIDSTGKRCDFTPTIAAEVLERYQGSQINRSAVKDRIRWSSR